MGETKKKATADALSWCEEFQQNLTSAGIAYPNEVNGTKEMHTFQTITDPPFFMSVHRQEVDRIRFEMMGTKTYYEKQMTANFVKILKNRTISGRVIDVGMNIGWFTLLSRSLGHEILSFEPNPSNIVRLCESLALNDWTDGVIIYPYALGDIEDTMLLSWPLKNPGEASLTSKNTYSTSIVDTFSTSISVKRLDDIVMSIGWLKEKDKPIYLLKIDVEGFEPNVLEGSRQLLQSGLLENILMEFNPNLFDDSSRTNSFITLLLQNHYELIGLLGWNGGHMIDATNHVRFDNLTLFVSDLIKLTEIQHAKSLKVGRLMNLWWKKKVAKTV